MKKFTFLAFMFISLFSYAQTDTVNHWKTEGSFAINFTQSYFSNWSAGGENSIAGMPKFHYQAIYTKDKFTWSNWANAVIGYSLIGDSKIMKTDDKLELITDFAYKFHKNWYFNLGIKFLSQFAQGFDYAVDSTHYISKFMSPGYLNIGPGIEYKKDDWFILVISPFNSRFTFVTDQNLADQGRYGLDPAITDGNGNIITHANKMKYQFGAKLTAALKYEVFKNVTLGTRLELFSDYLDNPQNILVNWETLIKLKVNNWLSVDLSSQLVYDDSVHSFDELGNPQGPKVQFKEGLMLGIGINF
jgi:hypothetical protein